MQPRYSLLGSVGYMNQADALTAYAIVILHEKPIGHETFLNINTF